MLATSTSVFAQLQWSSYNTSGTLVTANVASGGDAPYGGNVTFTIPAATELVFMTKTFVPVSIAAASSSEKINFSLTANGGLYPGSTGRLFGMGLLNDGGTPSALDDTGYWVDFNTGNPSWELFDRPSTVATFFQYDGGDKLGTGKVATGYPTNNVTYGMQFQLNMNSGASSISIGTSSSSWAACGAGMTNGNGGVNEVAYSSGVALTTLPTTSFNEFAFMFNNTSGSSVSVTLNRITLAPANPEIISPPVNFSGATGSSATFTVVVNTNTVAPISYQWYETNAAGVTALANGATGDGSDISGATTASSTFFTNTLTFNNVQLADAGNIFVVITNVYGAVTSSPVAMAITASDVSPTINSISPTNAVVVAGQGTNFTVNATGSPSPIYYWYDNNNSLIQSGAGFTLALTNVQLANTGIYSVIVSNYLGSVSTNFAISVIVPPCISQQPSNVLLNVGDPANFYVVEGNCALPAPTYQWYKNGNLISGATGTSYSIASVALSDIATYTVVISNSAGSVTSTGAKLSIYSTAISGTPLLPANNGTGLCIDTYLEITFNQTPFVGNSGKVSIFDVSNPSTPVDTIDLSLNNNLGVQPRSLFPGDSQAFNYYPVTITGNTATIYPHSDILSTNKTYYVTIDPGVIVDSTGAYFVGISNSATWRFTTKSTGPANSTNLIVNASGGADFVTVQGAVDSIPLKNTNYTLINIHNGNYFEIVDIATKNNVTFRGQSRNGTFVGYSNNANIAPGGSTHARMAFKVNANDIAIENMTVTNSTPQGGSQAEALMIETGASRFILNNAEVDSRQDTILANVNSSQGYFYNSLVQGNYDYVWGGGNLFFTNCELRTITGASQDNFAAPRTDNGATGNWPGYSGLLVSNGFSFVDCRLTRQSGTVSCSMSDANGSPNGLAAWVNCSIDTDTFGYTNALAAAYNTQLLWEYGCSNLNNTIALNNSASPFIGFTQLNNADPRLLAAQNATNWLNGWQPQLAPNIITNPANQAVTYGLPATFTAAATGIPDPTYQWFVNGILISDATNAVFSIANTVRANAGNYSVVANNASGSVTSSVAVLTYNDTAPVAGPSFSIGALVGIPTTVQIIGGKYSPTDADGDVLSIISVTGSTNGMVTTDGTNVIYTATNGTSDSFIYTVSDGYGGTASATVSVTINPNAQGYNQLALINFSNSTNVVMFLGIPDSNYALDLATNLTPPVNWIPQTTNPAADSGYLSFTNISALPQSFYRMRSVP
jgi:pectin methylesterase-like acyl-CoA thioesterase